MAPPLDELYFQWLYKQVGVVARRKTENTYWNLLKLLFTKEFVWWVPNDDNRAQDGRELRIEFLLEERISPSNEQWESLGCDLFELLVGLSRRLSFLTGEESRVWFWIMIENLGLYQYNDRAKIPKETVEEVLEGLIWRTYDPDGNGGLFPLRNPKADQRKVELWYQASAYLEEHE